MGYSPFRIFALPPEFEGKNIGGNEGEKGENGLKAEIMWPDFPNVRPFFFYLSGGGGEQ